MNRKYRKAAIIANWKMNKTASQTRQFAEEFKEGLPKTKWCDIGICVPSVNISAAMRAFRETRVAIGAQDVYYEESGAYTGQISAEMLCDVGTRYVIIGHSERRRIFGDTDEIVRRKLHAATATGLVPILCVGETQEQRELGLTQEILLLQLKTALSGITSERLRRCIIAYEPVWAIGTGNTATGEQAQESCSFIRGILRSLYGARTARAVSILYGGSMTPANAYELLSHDDVDGGLIGGASLKADSLLEIVNAANQGERCRS